MKEINPVHRVNITLSKEQDKNDNQEVRKHEISPILVYREGLKTFLKRLRRETPK